MYEYLIIGAGITGITLCKKLREKGHSNLLVLEKNQEVGGLCRSQNIDGHILDIGGGHFFNSKFEDVKEFIFQYLPKNEFNYYERISKILLGDTTIDYPIESNIWQLPKKQMIEYIISVVRNGEALGQSEPHSYEEWIRYKLGDKICDEYMLPYNKKLWGAAPDRMDIDWLHKIPSVNVEEVLQYCIERKQDVSKFPAHIYFYYPQKGGFQAIIDRLAKDEMPYILCGERVEKLERQGDHWLINGKYQAKNVINTTPWNDLARALAPSAGIENAFEKILYNRLHISLWEESYNTDWHWRYIPDENCPYHREFYIHNYAPDSKKSGVYRETNVKRSTEIDEKDDKCLYCVETDAAYPIPVIGHADAIRTILNYYEPMRLYGVGRWGQHEYQNADVAIHEAFKFVERMV